MMLKNYKIEEFIDDLSSVKPTPGGGSVAGLIGALSGSLNSMVYSLTINKKSFEALDGDTKKLILDFSEASNKFTQKALNLMEDDRKYFEKLIDCYKLPKDSKDDKEKRSKAIIEGTVLALKAPLALAKEAYKFYDNIDVALEYGNKMLASDAICAAVLLHACIECAIVNVKVNLNSIRTLEVASKIKNEIEELNYDSLARKNSIYNLVNEVIYSEI